MSERTVEDFAEHVRACGRAIRDAQIGLAKAEASCKRIIAMKKTEAMGVGVKANNAQEDYADRSDEVYKARLAVGVARGTLDAAQSEKRAAEIEFELWRTKRADERAERQRYGA